MWTSVTIYTIYTDIYTSLNDCYRHVNVCYSHVYKMWQQNKKVFFISISGAPSVNRINLPALTLAEPNRTNLVPEPLAVLHLDNQQFKSLYTLPILGGPIFSHFFNVVLAQCK